MREEESAHFQHQCVAGISSFGERFDCIRQPESVRDFRCAYAQRCHCFGLQKPPFDLGDSRSHRRSPRESPLGYVPVARRQQAREVEVRPTGCRPGLRLGRVTWTKSTPSNFADRAEGGAALCDALYCRSPVPVVNDRSVKVRRGEHSLGRCFDVTRLVAALARIADIGSDEDRDPSDWDHREKKQDGGDPHPRAAAADDRPPGGLSLGAQSREP